jgi:hypothetical protein
MSYPRESHPEPVYSTAKKSRKPLWILVGVLGVLLFCGLGGATLIAAGNEVANPQGEIVVPSPKALPATESPDSPVPAKPKAAKAAPKTIAGDDLVHVGEDVPAGTYRAVVPIDGGDCYWKKSRDAEGENIISNDIPAGGRPQVTLKSGQWFTSQGCPEWAKK